MIESKSPYITPEITEGKVNVVNIPKLFSRNKEPQVAVYGDKKFLLVWREAHNLDPENYPIPVFSVLI